MPKIENSEEDSANLESSSEHQSVEVVQDPKALEWEEARFRLRAYLDYWGIKDEDSLQHIQEEVLARVRARNDAHPVEDLPKCAIEEALAIVDGHILTVATSTGAPNAECMSSSSVFSPRIGLLFCRDTQDYPQRLFRGELESENMLPAIQWVQGICSVPAHHTLAMDPQKLMFYRPIVAVRRFLIWLLGTFLRSVGKLFTDKKTPD